MKISKHEIWSALTQLALSKIYQGNFGAVILRKKSEIVGENFFLALKMQFGRFYCNIRK